MNIQEELSQAELTSSITLNVKIGVGFGKATILHVGGVFNRIESLAMGAPLMQAFQCEGHSGPGIVSFFCCCCCGAFSTAAFRFKGLLRFGAT